MHYGHSTCTMAIVPAVLQGVRGAQPPGSGGRSPPVSNRRGSGGRSPPGLQGVWGAQPPRCAGGFGGPQAPQFWKIGKEIGREIKILIFEIGREIGREISTIFKRNCLLIKMNQCTNQMFEAPNCFLQAINYVSRSRTSSFNQEHPSVKS